jgi:hypothetical protein
MCPNQQNPNQNRGATNPNASKGQPRPDQGKPQGKAPVREPGSTGTGSGSGRDQSKF